MLPRELGLLLGLTRLTSAGNPLVHPPLAVARRGVAAVREYLLRHMPSQEEGAEEGEEEVAGVGEGGGAGAVCGAGEGEDEGQEEKDGSEDAKGEEPRRQEGRRAAAAVAAGPRVALGGSCVSCADKADRLEDLGEC